MYYVKDEAKLQYFKHRLGLSKYFENLNELPISLVEFEEGEPIYPAGSKLRYMFFVAEGRIRIHHISEAGRQFIVTYEDAPAFLGDVEFLDDTPSGNHVEAATSLTCLLLPMEQCRILLENDLLFYKFLCRSIAAKLVGVNKERQIGRLPLPEKLAAYLLHLCQSGQDMPSLQEVSEVLDCSYRHLLRSLREFCRQGILSQPKKGSYSVADPIKLIQLVLHGRQEDDLSEEFYCEEERYVPYL